MIVELEPIHHFVLCRPASSEPHSVEPLDLQGAEECFGYGVIPAIALALIDPRIPKAFNCFWKSPLAY